MYKNYGISRVGNYASLRGIKVSKVDQSGIDTETSFINPVIVDVRGKIGDENYVDSINQIEWYDVYADKIIFYVGNVDDRANCLKVEISCGSYSSIFYTDNGQIVSFELSRINDGYTFPLDNMINVVVKAVNSELEMESDGVKVDVKFQGVLDTPQFIGVQGSTNDSQIRELDPVDNVYYITPYIDENNKDAFKLWSQQFVMLISNCFTKAVTAQKGINGQVIKITYNDEEIIYGLRYNEETNSDIGELLLPKNALVLNYIPKDECFQITNINNDNSFHIIDEKLKLPFDTNITIKTYICKDNGEEIKSNYSNEIVINFVDNYPSLKFLQSSGILMPYEYNNKIYDTYVAQTTSNIYADFNLSYTGEIGAIMGLFLTIKVDDTISEVFYRSSDIDLSNVDLSLNTLITNYEWDVQLSDVDNKIINISAMVLTAGVEGQYSDMSVRSRPSNSFNIIYLS